MAAGSGGSSLGRYVVVRVALAPLFLLLLLTLIFVMLRVLPGDPYTAQLAGRLSAEQIQQRREAAGFDDPIFEQYAEYMAGVVQGDFGTPVTASAGGRSVGQLVADLLPATLELTMFAMTVAVTLGIFLGAVGARFRDGPFDVGGRLFGVLIYAAPVFWLGILAQLVFPLARLAADRRAHRPASPS